MSTLRTNNLQNPDSSSVNIELTQNGGAIFSGVTTVSSNLNVTGVLTYEDVTNIDSIGVVTARSSVNVGASGNPHGKLHVYTDSLNSDGGYNGQNFGIVVETEDGNNDGDEGNGICFTQQYAADGLDSGKVRTGAIIGYKDQATGNFGGGLKFKVQQFGATPLLTSMTMDKTGRIGIGSEIPTQTLDIMSANPVIRLTDTDPSGVYSQIDGAGGDLILAADGGAGSSDSFVSIRTDGTDANAERLRITSGGDTELRNRVAALTNTYSQYLKFRTTQTNNQSAVTGAIAAQGKSNWGGDLVFFSKDANGTPNDTVTERMRILSGGQVNIGGNYTQTSYQLQVDGSIKGDQFTGESLSNNTGYKWGASGMYTLTLGGSRSGNGGSFTMFEVHGMNNSKFFEIMINFGHAGGGIHGSYRKFAGFYNGYVAIQTLQDSGNVNYGGGGGFSITKPDLNTLRVVWNGASSYSDAYTLACEFKTSNGNAYFKNVNSSFS